MKWHLAGDSIHDPPSSPKVGGYKKPLQRVTNIHHPKKVTNCLNHQVEFFFATRWNVQLHAVRELFDENGAGEPTTAEGFKVEVWIHKKPFPPTAWRLVKWYVCLGDAGFQRQVWIGGGLKIDVVKEDRWWIGPSGGLLKRFFLIFFCPWKNCWKWFPSWHWAYFVSNGWGKTCQLPSLKLT